MAPKIRRTRDSSSISVEVDEQFACPFCDKTVTMGSRANSSTRVLVHPLPRCETYDRLSGEDYVTAVRAKRVSAPC